MVYMYLLRPSTEWRKNIRVIMCYNFLPLSSACSMCEGKRRSKGYTYVLVLDFETNGLVYLILDTYGEILIFSENV